MTRLNLMPWREIRQKELDRQVLTAAVGAWVVMAAIVGLAYIHVSALIDNQVRRNDYMKTEINKLNEQIAEIGRLKQKKAGLIARMKVIFQLQADRSQIVHMFDELVRKLPEGVYITTLRQKGGGLRLVGYAQSNARVSAFMRSLEKSDWFQLPSLDIINITDKRDGDRVSKFSLQVKRKVKKEEKNKSKKTAKGKKP
ncbi:MAG TPA: pilus assembly protein PilN [Acidiferrobacteraceae bacterium]|nr:pilus assembly protein PilN [Acidiferrobacteraceae bacterium]HEX19336.1 pilus assembly protein PilN [Acidiferrobacteraceae bacterium]